MNKGWLSRVDPLVKIAGAACWVAAGVVFHGTALLLLAAGALLLLAWSGAHRRPLILLWAFSGMAVLGATHLLIGGTVQDATHTMLRLFVLGAASLPLILTTDPAVLLRSLRRLPLPPGVLLGLSIMWRSLPMLKRELEALVFSARLDGERISVGNPRRFYRRVLVPLSFGMTGFADEMTLALVTRGIALDGAGRVLKPASPGWADAGFGLFTFLFLGAAAWTTWL